MKNIIIFALSLIATTAISTLLIFQFVFNKPLISFNLPLSTPTPAPSPSIQPSATAKATIKPSPTTEAITKDTLLPIIEKLFIDKYSWASGSFSVTISKFDTTHAMGGVKENNAVGGAMWLAAKNNDNWVLVFDGNGTIECKDVKPYNFPSSMLSECYNSASGKVQKL